MDRREFEQRLIEDIAHEVAEIAADRFRDDLANRGGRVFEIGGGEKVKLVAVDHYDVGGILITVETGERTRYLVRLEIQSGHYAFEAVPLDEHA
jgi:hypothetical protein